ncbi:NAD-dependent dehydratase [bacterium]|nr:NAD-dependent dehydratase [bacterium]|tara:strand:+ start:1805 stop:2803 length:999 start_codon:yes stop_codon:yes gene_type:complete
MKHALVTGADGFIGSHLVEMLIRNNFKVTAFCLYNSQGSWGWLDCINKELYSNLEVILGDIRDPLSVRKAMKDCDIVFHLAALIAIPYSYTAPSSYVDTNISGTLNILQASLELEIDHLVHTSTSETYGSAQTLPISEGHPLVAQSPYAATKIAADQLALSYWRSFDLPVTVLRPFNTYGPRQSNRAVIPTIITQIASGERVIKLGAITPSRDFNYVFDTCSAFLETGISRNTVGKVINSASGFDISIGDTAELIADVMGVKIEISSDELRLRPEKSEVNRLLGDNTLIRKLTDWEPKYSGIDGLRKGISETVDWFKDKNNISRYKPHLYQI